MSCPLIFISNTIELTVHTSCNLGLRLTLCYFQHKCSSPLSKKKFLLTTVYITKLIQPNTIRSPKINPVNADKKTIKKSVAKNFTVAMWNIKRGLVKRELEIIELLKNEDINVLFLTESDVILGNTQDYKIEG